MLKPELQIHPSPLEVIVDILIVFGFLSAMGYLAYRSGKHIGSKKGFAVGRWRRR